MAIFYNHDELAKLVDEGGKVSRSGSYVVWLWAKDGTNVSLEVAGEKFPPTHVGEVTGKLSWVKVGEVELEAGQRFDVRIDIDVLHSYFGYQPEMLGQMALSLDSSFHPADSFELMRVFVDSAEPTDDRRIAEIRHIDMP